MNVSSLSKVYDPKTVEPRLYERWESEGYFHADPDPARPPFIICMPPPNVTGRAHLGHGSTYTPMDVLVRYHRMQGNNADWLPGLDHAAIATEAVLIRELAREGQSRESLGRERYLERAWDWSRSYSQTIVNQFRTLGFGPDWQRERFTMDAGLSAAVRQVFVRLYREGLIYRGKRLINWDPKAKTTISDAEIDHIERDAHLWRIVYPFAADGTQGITVATTRPETMLGDVAIAVHPDDERYRDRIGTTVLVPPLLVRRIPIIADDSVDPSFGTGAVKVTPAHDPTDYDIGLRHNLPMPSILDEEARITDRDAHVMGTETLAGAYTGLDRFEARTRIVEDVRSRGLLVAEEPYRHAVATSERSGEIVEPLLSEQWFISMKPLAQPALEAYRNGQLRFVPERYGRTYEQWLENMRDWNISRQVWWGHQLPVWYTSDGEVVIAETEEEAQQIADATASSALPRPVALRRDSDTLDTWFSSGLWPFSILGWPDRTPELAAWYPSQVLVTAWEIIPLWVSRMVMFGLHFTGEVPFPTVFIAPLVFDSEGRKMSKSLGNAIDPMGLVEKYGADAFRMGIMRQMRLEGQELRFQESRCEEARNFNNKIWNATRYLLALPEQLPSARTLPAPSTLTLADRWILTRLHDTIVEVGNSLDGFDFGVTAETLWKFIWYELCDWYIEASKEPANLGTRTAVLSFVMNNAMRLLHPLEPFITEEIWLALPHDGPTIVTAAWPDPEEVPVDRDAEQTFTAIRRTIERLRNERAENGIADMVRTPMTIPKLDGESPVVQLVLHLARGQSAERVGSSLSAQWDPRNDSLENMLAAIQVRIDPSARITRYQKEAVRLASEITRSEKKLANEQFVSKAAPELVAKEQEKLANYRSDLERLQTLLASAVAETRENGKGGS